ncbi:MAG: hypothetical protein CMJ20_11845 [Phycisphaeraceae bacterium]|nr:hypothetical protein [Phycisphaeraceae bacterium]|tara:strand:+ start:232 stop:1296 length:1065 start_codon:yes stop_codon:yes gene_type:complete
MATLAKARIGKTTRPRVSDESRKVLANIQQEFARGSDPPIYSEIVVGSVDCDAIHSYLARPNKYNCMPHQDVFPEGTVSGAQVQKEPWGGADGMPFFGWVYTYHNDARINDVRERLNDLWTRVFEIPEAYDLFGFYRAKGPRMGFGLLWPRVVYPIAWGASHPMLVADRCLIVRRSGTNQGASLQSIEEPVLNGWELLFAHDFYCQLRPDVFAASAIVIDILLDVDDPDSTTSHIAAREHAHAQKKKIPIERPSDRALKAWRLRDLAGISNQSSIAKRLTEEGEPATQGQVSRWLRDVEKYLKDGNVLPELPKLEGRPAYIDPNVITMGKRRDGLTKRQRPKRTADDRHGSFDD